MNIIQNIMNFVKIFKKYFLFNMIEKLLGGMTIIFERRITIKTFMLQLLFHFLHVVIILSIYNNRNVYFVQWKKQEFLKSQVAFQQGFEIILIFIKQKLFLKYDKKSSTMGLSKWMAST
jgi:hypothetical protein